MVKYMISLSPTVIEPGSPLYEGMVEIAQRAERGDYRKLPSVKKSGQGQAKK